MTDVLSHRYFNVVVGQSQANSSALYIIGHIYSMKNIMF